MSCYCWVYSNCLSALCERNHNHRTNLCERIQIAIYESPSSSFKAASAVQSHRVTQTITTTIVCAIGERISRALNVNNVVDAAPLDVSSARRRHERSDVASPLTMTDRTAAAVSVRNTITSSHLKSSIAETSFI